ncbi:hypothetical protein GALMADRAFT_230486 [Galerina marginata CBS 339.88]|uniref:F-box domain-containing protein n=1 Tax=Galerina marginata (strain CBS 339.88) TaxID=685588 RepID=A0A067SSR6_GALM3|nr:hypothetical protein GALMADRAFT_230486 [Galerina marginata CBS 339.88]
MLSSETTRHYPPEPTSILRLPFEITAEIFAFYTETQHNCDVNSKSGMSAPLLLAAVCKTWREIALTTPQLWTTINIFIPSFAKIPFLTELAESWMKRSGDLPLNIKVSISGSILSRVKSHQEDISRIFDSIRCVSPRWRRLALEIPADLYHDFLGPLTDAPLLCDLRLIPIVYQDSLKDDGFHLSNTPRLTHLQISRIFVSTISIPWQNLTAIEAASIYIDEMIELLRSSNQLVSSKFTDIVGNGEIFPFPSTPLVHQYLKYLEVSPRDIDDISEFPLFLQNVTFPSLESFVYTIRAGFPVDDILSLFDRSQCSVKIFKMAVPEADDDLDVTEAELIRLLEGIPTITDLSVSLLDQNLPTIFSDHFISRLYLTPNFLPNLEVLSFVGPRRFSWERVADLLEAIPVNAPTIRSVELRVTQIISAITKPSRCYIGELDLSRLVHLATKNPGTILNIVDNATRMDIIAASLELYWPTP